MHVAAVLLAAGRGERFGGSQPKVFASVAGRALVLRSLAALAAAPEIEAVVAVVAADRVENFESLARGAPGSEKLSAVVAGGAERQDSVRAGLAALPPRTEWVAVHDAARALLRPEAVSRVVAGAAATGAALLAVPLGDTVKRVAGDRVVETPARADCRAAQTPQVFRVELLREALAKAAAEGVVGTDDAQLVERLGVEVRVVEGDRDNLKLTHPEDLALAEYYLERRGEA